MIMCVLQGPASMRPPEMMRPETANVQSSEPNNAQQSSTIDKVSHDDSDEAESQSRPVSHTNDDDIEDDEEDEVKLPENLTRDDVPVVSTTTQGKPRSIGIRLFVRTLPVN